MVKKSIKKTASLGDPKDHLANERTFLAWIRTSIGIMAFGFVIQKFALFIKETALFLMYQNLQGNQPLQDKHQNPSLFGVALIGIGSLIGLLSFMNYKKTAKQIETGQYRDFSILAIVVTVLIALIGIFLVAYLVIDPYFLQ